MGKIKLEYDDETGAWYEDESANIEVEIPDAIIADWRETRRRLTQIHDYFDETAKPQMEAEYARRREEWRRTHPEEAKLNDLLLVMWSKNLFDQVENRHKLLVHQQSFRLFDDNLIPPDKKDDE